MSKKTASSLTFIFSYKLFVLAIFVLAIFAITGCKTKEEKKTPLNPNRCNLIDLGEASDLIESGKIPNDQYVIVHGIADPRTLIWKDPVTQKIFFVSKIAGTQRRLFYTQEIAIDEEPKLLSDFKGTITLWKNLPKEDAVPMAKAFERDWKTKINVENTYLIQGSKKPTGCK